jgi:hypothetical protein
MKRVHSSFRISVEWGYEVHSIVLGERTWREICGGHPKKVRGSGYRHEGEFFWDYWIFNSAQPGSLVVEYGKDGGVGFVGDLKSAEVEETA